MKLDNFLGAVLVGASFAVLTVGCTTANYGLKPAAVDEQKDTYRFKLFVGGFSGGETADKAVQPDIEEYRKNNGYKSYTIVDKRYNLIPSYFEYTVRFNR
jgi:hypothetical protein